MSEDARVSLVCQLLVEHTKSPSLRHVRDPYALRKLAAQIVRSLDRGNPLWTKWNGPRETLLAAASRCWIPIEDMRDRLNQMEGQSLTATDVEQRLEAFHLEQFPGYPNEELRESCLAVYQAEKSSGTEMRAIVGALQLHVESEEARFRLKREAEWRERANEERRALEQRFLSGADCKWTPIQKSKEIYCRINGRTYRLTPTKEKMWDLHRIKSERDISGVQLGCYKFRGDANKALKQIAFQPEPRY